MFLSRRKKKKERKKERKEGREGGQKGRKKESCGAFLIGFHYLGIELEQSSYSLWDHENRLDNV